LRKMVSDIEVNARSAAMSERQKAESEKIMTQAKNDLEKYEKELEENKSLLSERKNRCDVLDACEIVLGLRGVRALVTGKALSGLEALANVWLVKIADGMTIRLKSYTEKKTGGISDCISLDVEGAGGGHGYKASSGGQRRRIDVAILLALSEMSGNRDFIALDEIFDTLDIDGIESVSNALDELAKDRCVVVISHNEDLKNRLHCEKVIDIQPQ